MFILWDFIGFKLGMYSMGLRNSRAIKPIPSCSLSTIITFFKKSHNETANSLKESMKIKT